MQSWADGRLAVARARVERVLKEIAALDGACVSAAQQAWVELRELLLAELAFEEQRMPELRRVAPGDALCEAFEHLQLRGGIADLDRALREGRLRPATVQRFAAEIATHHEHEAKLVLERPRDAGQSTSG
jgi:hypothetical protein